MCVARTRDKGHSKSTWIREMGNANQIADRSQVIGGKLLMGQLAPWVI